MPVWAFGSGPSPGRGEPMHHWPHPAVRRFFGRPGIRPSTSGDRKRRFRPFRAGLAAVATVLASVSGPARPAVAAEGIYLSWDGCRAASESKSNRNFACDLNGTRQELFVEFIMPQAADNVIAIEIVIDIQHAN